MNRPNPNKNRRVLVIDDNPAIHDDFRKILSPAENRDAALSLTETKLFGDPLNLKKSIRFEVDSAFQGEQGVAMVKKAWEKGLPYAVAFVDMQMPPGWNGVKTTREVWKVTRQIQIVICTAYSAHSWEELFDIAGHDDRPAVLKKPFDPDKALQLAIELTEKWTVFHSRSDTKTLRSRDA